MISIRKCGLLNNLKKISKLKNGHSMWEMSTINEKNIFKSSNIKECLKLLGLILFIKKSNENLRIK